MHPYKPVPNNAVSLMWKVYRTILPNVRQELSRWRMEAERIQDVELRKQAIASMTTKQFHCEGGAVYAAIHIEKADVLIPLIVAFQTISDYLDNLCDRSTSQSEEDFRLLHRSMVDAIDPGAEKTNYYAHRVEQDDAGYLHKLVDKCQACIAKLPAYDRVQPYVQELVLYYSDLQVYKHIQHDLRVPKLKQWWSQSSSRYPELLWNEFAAATGSTLGVFMLFAAACNDKLTDQQVQQIRNAYFPYICGLHILLDYLIDQEEDRIGGDLNFCSFYQDDEQLVSRIRMIFQQAKKQANELEHASFHRMIIEGLLALYLSDPKVNKQKDVRNVSRQLMEKSPLARMFFWLNSKWIRKVL